MSPIFSFPINPQASSPLLQLAPELRQKILRCLLISSADARAKGRFDEEDSKDERPHLITQMMRCCQQLYDECEQILYGENKLSVSIDDNSLKVADGTFPTPDFYENGSFFPLRRGRPDLNLPELGARVVFKTSPSPFNRPITSVFNCWLSSRLIGVMRMRRVEFHLKYSPRLVIYDCMRLLWDVVANKDVSVYWDLENIKEARAIDILRGHYLWRCQSLTFHKLPPSLLHTANAVRALMMGQEPVIDLWYQAHCLSDLLNSESTLVSYRHMIDDAEEFPSEY